VAKTQRNLTKPPKSGRASKRVTKATSTVAGRARKEVNDGDEGLIGQHLESLVVAAGMTPAEFATKIGKDRDTVTLYFGGFRLPKAKDYRRIATVLGLSNVRELLPDMPIRQSKKKTAN
jgi:hypothetical protein